MKLNIFNGSIIQELSKKFGYDIYPDLSLLNNINLRRRNKTDENFVNIGCILLSGNRDVLRLAWEKQIRSNGGVPLATNLDWLTNKFWFKLNKGFGNNNVPQNSDIIIKSKIILSSIIGDKVGIEYKKMMERVKDGKLTLILAQAQLVDLRRQAVKPEEIKENESHQILEFLDEDSLERVQKEQDLIKSLAENAAKDNVMLQNEIEDRKRETYYAKKEMLETKTKYLKTQDYLYNKVSNGIRFWKTLFKIGQFLIIPILGIILLILFMKILPVILQNFDDRHISILSIVINAVTFIFSILLSLFLQKNIDLLPLSRKIEQIIINKMYKKEKFDFNEYQQLKQEINALQIELVDGKE